MKVVNDLTGKTNYKNLVLANRTGLRTVSQMHQEKHYPGGINGLRRIIEDNKEGFTDACVRRVGRRIFVDLEKYYAWLEKVNEVA